VIAGIRIVHDHVAHWVEHLGPRQARRVAHV
jgi:hypothetical protein